MSRSDFHFEFNKEVSRLDHGLIAEAEERLRALANGHTDMVGAAVAVEELVQEETPHIYQARVVVYIRPENIAAVEKADTPDIALTEALDAVERQVRERRDKLRRRWQQPEQVTDQGVYELSAHEIYQTFADPADLLAMDRTDLATQLMIDKNLEEAAAFYAADQILTVVQKISQAEQPQHSENRAVLATKRELLQREEEPETSADEEAAGIKKERPKLDEGAESPEGKEAEIKKYWDKLKGAIT